MSAKSAQMQRLLDQLAAAENRVMGIAEDIRELVTKEAQPRQPEPCPSDGNRFSVSVQYTPDGKVYEYLILRVNGRYYTTAGGDSIFPSWDALLDWLERPEVYWHNSLARLSQSGLVQFSSYTRPS